jgi:ABC-type nitrate/sulfonate/bicarbonate transport system, ATPase component
MNSINKLIVEDLKISYGDDFLIEHLNIKVKPGEMVSIIGKSGSGKTTIFNAISGLIKPDSGKIFLNGEDVTGINGKVGYMLQKDLLLPFKTVTENVMLPLIIKKVNKKEALALIDSKLDIFGLRELKNKYPKELSGGQRQRVAFLRTYFFSSDMVLLDEPFSALDQITRYAMHDWYMSVRKELNLTTLLITHDIDETLLLSDKIYVLAKKGKEAKITNVLDVNLDERSTTSEEFIRLKKVLIEYLK